MFTVRLMIRLTESGSVPRIDLGDPYLIAYLRGGAKATLGVVVTSLVDRELLEVDPTGRVGVRDQEAQLKVRRPIERDVIRELTSPAHFTDLVGARGLAEALDSYRRELAQLKLVPDAQTYALRGLITAFAITFVIVVAIAKVSVAFARGRYNVGFLILFAVVAFTALIWVAARRRTGLGDRLLEDVRVLFRPLYARAALLSSGGTTSEAALVAAAFGLTVLPRLEFPQAHQFEQKTAWYRSSSDGSSSSGSSCGSSSSSSCSSGSSCGSSCGGGGGCGGCGS